MGLQGDAPFGVFEDIVHEAVDDGVAAVPVGLEEKKAVFGDFFGVFLCPREILLAADDHFEFISAGEKLRFWTRSVFRGETNPVPVATERFGARSFQEALDSVFVHPFAEIIHIIEHGFAAGDDHCP